MAQAKPRPKRGHGSDTISPYWLTGSHGTPTQRWRIAYWERDVAHPEIQRRRFKRGFADRVAAEAALAEVQVDMRRGDYQPPANDILNTFAESYFRTIRVRDSTLAGYRKHYRVHVRDSAIGGMKLTAITKLDLNRFYRTLEASGRMDKGHVGEPLSAATVRHVHTLLSQIFAAAVEDDLLRKNPAKSATPPTKLEAAPPEMQTWSAAEARSFLQWSRSRGDYLWLGWFLLLSTGLRRGELLALRWRDIDFDRGTIFVGRSLSHVKEAGVKPVISFNRPKSGKGRAIDIDGQLVEALKKHHDSIERVAPELGKADALIFHNRFGRPHNPVQFSKQWRDRVAQAQRDIEDLPTLHLHELRHTHATLLLTEGVHPKIVSERLGHASVSITMEVYSHAVPSLQRGAATAIGGLLQG